MESKWGIPKPTLNRLPVYYRRLLEAIDHGIGFVSSRELGAAAGVPDVQVRKDLTYLNQSGRSRSGVGYEAKSLANQLESYLGLKNPKRAALVGVGNLGQALALYPGFQHYGLQLLALFDNAPEKIGQTISSVTVEPITALPTRVRQMEIQLGIITVPVRAAQSVAQALVDGGVNTLWNFAPCHLEVPDEIMVKNEDLAAALAMLSHYLNRVD